MIIVINKERIINFNNITGINIQLNYISKKYELRIYYNFNDYIIIRKYETEESTQEVLGIIISHYNSDKKVCYLPEE